MDANAAGAGTESFSARWRARSARCSALCVGLDPSPELLTAWGLNDSIDGLRDFCDRFVDAVRDDVAVVKPQASWFERFGAAGVAVLEGVVGELRRQGVLVLLDAKRGDIGLTNLGYADAYLRPGAPCRVDALTLHPYLGVAALAPLFDAAAGSGAHLFVVAHSSNAEAWPLQASRDDRGVSVGDQVLDDIGAEPTATVGAVIGATVDGAGRAASRLGAGRLVLAPGLGAQGATVAGAREAFGDRWPDVIPSVSRAVLAAGPDRDALRRAVHALQTEVSRAAAGG